MSRMSHLLGVSRAMAPFGVGVGFALGQGAYKKQTWHGERGQRMATNPNFFSHTWG